jgi:hypothetical protein
MKKIVFIMTALMFSVAAFAVMPVVNYGSGAGEHLTTVQQKAELIVVADANMAALNVNTGMSWKACKANAVHIPTNWNAVSLSFYGWGDGGNTRGVADANDPGDPCNATFKFSVYACDLYGGLEPVVLDANGVIGSQQLSVNPVTMAELNAGDPNTSYCWAGTLNGSATDIWSKDIIYSNNLGTNYRAKLKFDRQEAYGIYVRIYSISSDVATITCVMNGF